jgi:MFS superfamily sulfate permease-like transporter
VSEQQRSQRVPASLLAGVIIGAVEALLAVSFAAFVFGGRLIFSLDDGIGLYLGAAAITLAFMAWRAWSRGVVGGVQEATAAVLAVVATTTALDSYGSSDRAFLTVVAATFVVMILTGAALFLLGTLR